MKTTTTTPPATPTHEALALYDRMVSTGSIDPDCTFCQDHFGTRWNPKLDKFAPRHTASSRCESGKHSHCTCDACF